MSTDTTPVELVVTTAARSEFAEQHRLPPPDSSAVNWDEVDRDLRALAAPVVAAELRRLSDHYGERAKRCDEHPASNDYDGSDQYVWGEGHGYSEVADDLLARAEELDGGV